MTRRPPPGAREAADRLHEIAHARLLARGRPTTDRRFRGIVWWDHDDEPPEPHITVGEDMPHGPKGDPVLVILESARFDDMYFVSTLRQFQECEPPRAIALGKWWRVVEFDCG